MPQASLRSSVATRSAGAVASLDVARAPTVALGDVLAVHLGYPGAVGLINQPPGWTLWFATTSGSVLSQAWYWRIATTVDLTTSTYTFAFDSSKAVVAHCHAIRDADDDPTNWIKIQSVGTSTTPTAAALIAQQPTVFLLHGTTTVVVSGVTPPAGYTEVLDTDASVAAPNTVRISDSTLGQAADGTTGAVASSIASSQAWVASLIVIPSADYPTWRASTTGTTTTVSASVTVPAGTLAGEFRLVAIRIPNQTTTVTTPAGWTLIGPQASNATGAFRVYWFWRIAGGTPGVPTTDATQVFTLSTAVTTTGWQSSTIRRTHATTPVGASALNANAATATTYAHPGVTTLNANSLVVTSFHASSAATWTPPTGTFERSDATNNEVADRVKTTAGATGTLTGTLSVTGFGVGLAIEIRYGAKPTISTPTFWGSTVNAGGSGQTSLVATKPTNLPEEGIVVVDASAVADGVAITPPAGWTLISGASGLNTGASPDHLLNRYWKRMAAGEATTWTFTIAPAASTQAKVYGYVGLPPTGDVLVASSVAIGNTAGTSVAPGSVTSVNANDLLLFFLSTFGTTAPSAAPTAPAGMTVRGSGTNQSMAEKILATPGATGAGAWTISSDFWTGGFAVLAAPAAVVAPPPRYRRDYLRRR